MPWPRAGSAVSKGVSRPRTICARAPAPPRGRDVSETTPGLPVLSAPEEQARRTPAAGRTAAATSARVARRGETGRAALATSRSRRATGQRRCRWSSPAWQAAQVPLLERGETAVAEDPFHEPDGGVGGARGAPHGGGVEIRDGRDVGRRPRRQRPRRVQEEIARRPALAQRAARAARERADRGGDFGAGRGDPGPRRGKRRAFEAGRPVGGDVAVEPKGVTHGPRCGRNREAQRIAVRRERPRARFVDESRAAGVEQDVTAGALDVIPSADRRRPGAVLEHRAALVPRRVAPQSVPAQRVPHRLPCLLVHQLRVQVIGHEDQRLTAHRARDPSPERAGLAPRAKQQSALHGANRGMDHGRSVGLAHRAPGHDAVPARADRPQRQAAVRAAPSARPHAPRVAVRGDRTQRALRPAQPPPRNARLPTQPRRVSELSGIRGWAASTSRFACVRAWSRRRRGRDPRAPRHARAWEPGGVVSAGVENGRGSAGRDDGRGHGNRGGRPGVAVAYAGFTRTRPSHAGRPHAGPRTPGADPV